MRRGQKWVVDTNVPIVANGRIDPSQGRVPTPECQETTVQFLVELRNRGMVMLDDSGEVVAEYRNHLSPSGQPGVGDRFYYEILNSHPDRVVRIALARRDDGQYKAVPQHLIDEGFDPSDRKFIALALAACATVANATDSDWIEHKIALDQARVRVNNLCGCDPRIWFNN
jgi:hypothetical protein